MEKYMKNILGIIFATLIVTATGDNHVRAAEQTKKQHTTVLRQYIDLRKSLNGKVDDKIKRFSEQTVNDKSCKNFYGLLDQMNLEEK